MQTKESGFRECRQRIGDLGQRVTLNYLLCLLKCTFQWVLYMGKYDAVGTKASGGFNGKGGYLSLITWRKAKNKQCTHLPNNPREKCTEKHAARGNTARFTANQAEGADNQS